MSEDAHTPAYTRLSGEDLTFWWTDSPMQPTTMAMLMILDRKPDSGRLHAAFERAVAAVPRLVQRVAEAPLDLTLPHWELDPTFDLEYHVREHALQGTADMAELLNEISPAYETPFDRSRPLWEARFYHGLAPGRRSAVFFKLHHAVADGIGGNAIFAALTDAERETRPGSIAQRKPAKGAWPREPSMLARVTEAIQDRVELDLERAKAVAGTIADTVRHPDNLRRALQAIQSIAKIYTFDSRSPVKNAVGRARRLSCLELPFHEVRQLKIDLGGSMIDVILTIMARGIGKWYAAHRLREVNELMTLVPVNLRKRDEWAENVKTGNVATGILVPLPIRTRGPLEAYREIHRRMEEKKTDPASTATPMLAEICSILPRRFLTWMTEASFGTVDFIVTNVPGILVPRYLAGAEILSTYPFAPVAMKSPASIALYGYRDHLYVGIDSDQTSMPDVERFQEMIRASFEELRGAVRRRRPRRQAPRDSRKKASP